MTHYSDSHVSKNIEFSHNSTLNSLQGVASSDAPPLYNVPPPNLYIPPYIQDRESCGPAFVTNQQMNVFVPPYPPPDFQTVSYSFTNYDPNSHCDPYNINSYLSGLKKESNYIPNETFASNSNVNVSKREEFKAPALTSDISWMESWVSKKIKITSSPSTVDVIKIHEAKQQFKKIINLLHDSEALKRKIQDSYKEMDSSEWNSVYQKLEDKKKEISDCMQRLPSIKDLQAAINKRNKKRKYQNRKNNRWKEVKSNLLENRLVLHHKIDTWLKSMQETIDHNKREESLKKEADSVLSDVLKKKSDGRRQLALVESLLKLRQLRAKSATNCGQHIPAEAGIQFEKVAENLKSLWEKQLKEYYVEEQGMRVMLSEAVDERDQSQVTRERQILARWDKLMFGSRSCDFPGFYLVAEKDVESFIDVRKSWDKFIVTNTTSVQSSIPIGWVLPSNPSSPKWESLLALEKSDA